jgi:hypothetical protein
MQLMQQEIAKMCDIMSQQATRKRGKAGGKRHRIQELER